MLKLKFEQLKLLSSQDRSLKVLGTRLILNIYQEKETRKYYSIYCRSLQSPTGATKKKKEIAKDKASYSPFNKTIQKKKTK